MKEYTPKTKLLILVGLVVGSWVILGLALYGLLQIVIKALGQGI